MAKRSRSSREVLRQQYETSIYEYESLCTTLVEDLTNLLKRDTTPLCFPIQHRIKSWDLINQKLDQFSIPLESLYELQDIAGVRLVLLSQDDGQNVCDILPDFFTVVRQYHTRERLKDDQFGYASFHAVLQMETTLGPLLAEIQVRTLAQHIWAEISHRVAYKQKDQELLPHSRPLYRISALLEVVDSEITRVLHMYEDYRYQQAVIRPSPILTSEYNEYGGLQSALEDINNDGRLETIRPATEDNQIIEVYVDDGINKEPIPVEPIENFYGFLRDVYLVDIDHDGQAELACYLEGATTGSGFVFYKEVQGQLKLLRKAVLDDTQHLAEFYDATIEDVNDDGWLEIVSRPWISIPVDLLPPNHTPDDYDMGRIKYIWRWSPAVETFVLVSRMLEYIGGR